MSNEIDMRPVHELTTDELAAEFARRNETTIIAWSERREDGDICTVIEGAKLSVIGLSEIVAVRVSHVVHNLVSEDEHGD